MRFFKYLIVSLIIIALVISGFLQYKAEAYISHQFDKYLFLQCETRKSIKPYILFYYDYKVKKKYSYNLDEILKIYSDNNVTGGDINISYELYLYHCYGPQLPPDGARCAVSNEKSLRKTNKTLD